MDDVFLIFFFQKTGFDILCKLSALETICIKCQNLFSGKNIKYFFLWSAEKFTQSALREEPFCLGMVQYYSCFACSQSSLTDRDDLLVRQKPVCMHMSNVK